MSALAPAGVDFELPDGLIATEPPEAHGAARDGVRLMVVDRGDISHTVFSRLGAFLRPGDLLVVNTSATVAAAADARRADGRPVVVHFAGPSEEGAWLVELRKPDQSGPVRDVDPGEILALDDGSQLQVLAPATSGSLRLWEASLANGRRVSDWLRTHARPITYAHAAPRPLADYQTVFARDPGSAEMPSAARPFTLELVIDLLRRGINVAPVVLHAGVSSLEIGELPPPERFEVSAGSAQLINAAREAGNRVIAVGTTVARAVESLVAPDGWIDAGSGWTDLVLSPDRPARLVDGLITGWHEPRSTHLLLLESVAGHDAVSAAYASALDQGYHWHEFGDSCLLLR